jgi:hypothetical protein
MSGKILPPEQWKKLPEHITSAVDTYEKSRERLCLDKVSVENAIRRLDNYICAQIAEWALLPDKSETVNNYGEALRHQQCGITPSTEKLGYAIANGRKSKIKAADQHIIDIICCFFDKTEYVFSYTHYDEANGDYYFRRS